MTNKPQPTLALKFSDKSEWQWSVNHLINCYLFLQYCIVSLLIMTSLVSDLMEMSCLVGEWSHCFEEIE